jgi:hypothetical protein
MSISRAAEAAGRLRFKDAVPVRRDRRDLRRRFRQAARAVQAEQRAEVTALLHRLSAGRTLLAYVKPEARGTSGVVEFLDGTRLQFATGRGGMTLVHLSRWHRASPAPLRLVRVQPSFTRRRFRLWFASASSRQPTEVVAEVSAFCD